MEQPSKEGVTQAALSNQRWLTVDYPAIQARAKEEKAEIHWGDETGLRSDCQHVRGYAPKGQTPVLRHNAKRASINLISTITHRGKVRFRICNYSGYIM